MKLHRIDITDYQPLEHSLPSFFADMLVWIENRTCWETQTPRQVVDAYIDHLSPAHFEFLPVGAAYELADLLALHVKKEVYGDE
jgi:hypothetical protein